MSVGSIQPPKMEVSEAFCHAKEGQSGGSGGFERMGYIYMLEHLAQEAVNIKSQQNIKSTVHINIQVYTT